MLLFDGTMVVRILGALLVDTVVDAYVELKLSGNAVDDRGSEAVDVCSVPENKIPNFSVRQL